MKHVTSRANPLFRGWLKLATSRRARREQGLTLIDGVHLLEAYLQRGRAPREVIVSEDAADQHAIARLLARVPVSPVIVSDRLFEGLTELTTPTGILAVIEIPTPRDEIQAECALLLEDIQDPGNLGSILRTAAAAGVGAAWLSKGCADAWSPRVLRGGMGAHFCLPIHERKDLVDTALRRPGRTVALSADAPCSLYELDLTSTIAFAFGNEATGLSPALREAASDHAAIPMDGHVESLNVGAAAAVCLFERMRQRSLPAEAAPAVRGPESGG